MKDKIQYPSLLKVGEVINPITKNTESVIISTGPYSRDKCGSTQKEVNEYLAHLQDAYDNNKLQKRKDDLL